MGRLVRCGKATQRHMGGFGWVKVGEISDGEWSAGSGDDDPLSDHGREDEDEDGGVLRGRVRPHATTLADRGPEADKEN